MLLDPVRLRTLAGLLDLLAISLDGVPASHNRMRASIHAFPTMRARLGDVRRSRIPFGFLFTLTQHNLHELDGVARFAVDESAALRQVHPLAVVGRAQHGLQDAQPDQIEASSAFIEVARIQQSYGRRLLIQFDSANREQLRANPGSVFATSSAVSAMTKPLAELASPLTVEADGMVVPLAHGFPRQYAVGDLHERSLSDLADAWKRDRFASFRALCLEALSALTTADAPAFANWFEAIAAREKALNQCPPGGNIGHAPATRRSCFRSVDSRLA